jgi:hypothetical protein
MNALSRMAILLAALNIFFTFDAKSQYPTLESAELFFSNGLLEMHASQDGRVIPLAYNMEFSFRLFWFGSEGMSQGAYLDRFGALGHSYVTDESNVYINMNIPTMDDQMLVRIDRIEGNMLYGELMRPEYQFYDPANPPVIPPPVYITFKRTMSKTAQLTEEQVLGKWEVVSTQTCEVNLIGSIATLLRHGEGSLSLSGEESYLAWRLTPSFSYIFLDAYADAFSQALFGYFADKDRIIAVSSLTGCTVELKRN